MAPLRMVTITLVSLAASAAFADDVLYRYEGDVLPSAAGWAIFDPCENYCKESVENGSFVLRWGPQFGDLTNYTRVISRAPDKPPPSLWVEWRFRSNVPIPRFADDCDALFVVNHRTLFDLMFLFGNAVVSFSGDDWLLGLALDEFHTYRFESPNGVNYWFSVDGVVFYESYGQSPDDPFSYLQFGGGGGCGETRPPDPRNEWDYIRYGTISFGEKIVASDPPGGFLDPRRYPSLDRFTITFDSPNYVYLDDVTVEMTDTPSCADKENLCPSVIQTRRLDNGDPEVVEIVLDRPIPTDGRTVFTLSDGVAVNTVQYTYIQGDVNADGAFDLADLAELGNCFGVESPTGRCYAFDFDDNGLISLSDYATLHALLTGPQP